MLKQRAFYISQYLFSGTVVAYISSISLHGFTVYSFFISNFRKNYLANAVFHFYFADDAMQ